MVSHINARVELFRKIFNHLNKDPPTYTDREGVTKTYTILSAYPEADPTFPCIVVNPLTFKIKFLGVDERPNKSVPASFDIDFFAKCKDGKNAVDIARDKIQMILEKNWITETTTIDTDLPGITVNIQGVE